ncbi:MAG: fibronectin type III domain-containing protein [Flavobacteriales bacterium]|nr:fibronectin type III domain-containing protein [Flavobacteriales bacterium]
MRSGILGGLLLALLPHVNLAQQEGGPGRVAQRILALQAQVAFQQVAPFALRPATPSTEALWREACAQADVLHVEDAMIAGLLGTRSPALSLMIPTGAGSIVLDLERVQPTTEEFRVVAASGTVLSGEPGLHYRGVVRGAPGSLAAISIFPGQVMGLWNSGGEEVVLGPFQRSDPGLHVLYRTRHLRGKPNLSCGVDTHDGPYTMAELTGDPDERTIRCVKWYWEGNHNIYLSQGNLTNTINHLTGLFNQSAILFDNEGIDVLLNELFVWDVPSPYTGTTSGTLLSQFGAYRTSFNGDLAHLLSQQSTGGVAWLNTLCNPTASYRMAYSGIHSSYANVPTYSWSVMVVSHEQGHNLGSPHTHACAWNGNATAIDGCGPTAGYTEGSCPTAPLPAGGGTIMSYCHLVGGTGINFNNGFGPQPAALMRNRVNAATCLAICGTTCDAPGNLSVQNLTTTSVTLTWANVGAQSYTLRWKAVSAGTWNTITGIVGTSQALTSLTPEVAYEFQVLSVCPAASSAYSSSFTFTTPAPCPDALEPNNTLATAAAVTLPANISALIATAGDVDHYSFTAAANSTITISLSGLPADYDLRLLTSGGVQLATSQNGGTSSEFISYPGASAGTYIVHVYGYAGAFHAQHCYALFIHAYASSCVVPVGLAASGITTSEALLAWAPVPAATSYDLQWRVVGAPAWTVVNGITGSSHFLDLLDPDTNYEFRVRSVCTGGTQGGSSAYSSVLPFTTLALPCELNPTVRVAPKVLLDGPWKTAAQLMADSLRTHGLVPLTEPYTALGYLLTGTATTTPGVLVVTGADAIVDWVVVELRSASAPATVVEARAALVQRDGDVVATDGTSPVGFCQPAGSYHVAVRHRNHLGTMTSAPLALTPTATNLDLSQAATAAFGTNARKAADGRMMLWAGNVQPDGQVKYSGPANDRDLILTAIGGSVPTNTLVGYHPADVNLDGVVKYSGPGNDRDPILSNIGGSVPTNILEQQLP